MPKYVLAYHGGATPDDVTEEEMGKVMAAWQSWMESLGSDLTDQGNPIMVSKTVTASGVEDGGGANPLTGYSLLNAADIDAAAAAAKGCPIFESGGTVEVGEAIEM